MRVIETQLQWWTRNPTCECFSCHRAFRRGYFVYVIQPTEGEVGLLCRKCFIELCPEEDAEMERTYPYVRGQAESIRIGCGEDKGVEEAPSTDDDDEEDINDTDADQELVLGEDG